MLKYNLIDKYQQIQWPITTNTLSTNDCTRLVNQRSDEMFKSASGHTIYFHYVCQL